MFIIFFSFQFTLFDAAVQWICVMQSKGKGMYGIIVSFFCYPFLFIFLLFIFRAKFPVLVKIRSLHINIDVVCLAIFPTFNQASRQCLFHLLTLQMKWQRERERDKKTLLHFFSFRSWQHFSSSCSNLISLDIMVIIFPFFTPQSGSCHELTAGTQTRTAL